MRCANCQEELNPTLVYCASCGAPVDIDAADLIADEDARFQERRQIEALQKAKDLLVLALFLFGVTVACRIVLLSEQHYDHAPGYRVPYAVVSEAGIQPPAALEVEPLPIRLPGN